MNRLSTLLALCALLPLLLFSSCTPSASSYSVSEADSLYIRGLGFEERQQPDSAFLCYQEAIRLLEGSKENERLVELLIKSGEIVHHNRDYLSAKEIYRNAISHAANITDKSLLSKSYRRYGKVCGFMKQYDSTLLYYKEAEKLLPLVCKKEQADIFNNLSALYLQLHNLTKALDYNTRALAYPTDSATRYSNLLSRGRIYADSCLYDSAKFYCHQVAQSHDVVFKVSAYYVMHCLIEKLGIEDTDNYSGLCIYWKDSLNRTDHRVEFLRTKHAYDLQQTKALHQKETSHNRKVFVFLLVICCGVMLFLLHWRKKVSEKSKATALKEEAKRHAQALSMKEADMQDLQTKIESLEASTQKEAEIQASALHQKGNEAAHTITRHKAYKDGRQKLTLAIRKSGHSFNLSDRKALLRAISTAFESYIADLKAISMFKSEDDYLFCCILYLDFTPKELQQLYHVEDNTIRMRRRRLKTKMEASIIGKELAKLLFPAK